MSARDALGSLLLVVLRRRCGGFSSAFVFSNDPNRYRRRDVMPISSGKYFSDR